MLSSALLRRGYPLNTARKGTLTVFALMMMSAIPAVLVPQAWLAIALVSIAMTGYTGCNANMLAIPGDVFPKNTAGSVFGIASMGSGFGGMLFTLITGWLVDHYSYTPVFFVFGLLPLVFTAILWRYLGRVTPMEPLPILP